MQTKYIENRVVCVIGLITIAVIMMASMVPAEVKAINKNKQLDALCRAAKDGDTTKIDSIVESGVDINAKGKSSATALACMLRSKNLTGFARLLEHGANPNLIESQEGFSVMYILVLGDSPEMLKIALENGGDPNLAFGKEKTPMLMVAIQNSRLGNVEILLNAGADIDGQDINGMTPLHDATLFNHFELVLDFLERGADYNLTSVWGKGFTWTLKKKIDKNLVDPSSEQYMDMQKVITFLEERDVEIN